MFAAAQRATKHHTRPSPLLESAESTPGSYSEFVHPPARCQLLRQPAWALAPTGPGLSRIIGISILGRDSRIRSARSGSRLLQSIQPVRQPPFLLGDLFLQHVRDLDVQSP